MAIAPLRFGDSATIDILGLVDGGGTPTVFEAGDALRFTVKRAASDPDALAILRLSTADGITVDEGESTGVIVIAPEHWQGPRSAGNLNAIADLQLTRGGEVTTLTVQRVVIRPDVTHS